MSTEQLQLDEHREEHREEPTVEPVQEDPGPSDPIYLEELPQKEDPEESPLEESGSSEYNDNWSQSQNPQENTSVSRENSKQIHRQQVYQQLRPWLIYTELINVIAVTCGILVWILGFVFGVLALVPAAPFTEKQIALGVILIVFTVIPFTFALGAVVGILLAAIFGLPFVVYTSIQQQKMNAANPVANV